jgi:hypothetical protein
VQDRSFSRMPVRFWIEPPHVVLLPSAGALTGADRAERMAGIAENDVEATGHDL